MAGADGQSLCWDLSRQAASFLRMARLALTGASPAQLVAEPQVGRGGHICDLYYKSISTEDDDVDDLEPDELRLEEDESELLVDDGDEDGRSATRGGAVSGNKNSDRFVTRRHRAPFRSANDVAAAAAAAEEEEESSEPLVSRRAVKRANDAEAMAQHPFVWGRRGSESPSSALLLVSS